MSSEPSKDLPAADLDNLDTLKAFYGSCLDQDRLDRQGTKPITKLARGILTAWRGEDLSTDSKKKHKKNNGRWNKHTLKERLTATLSYLHARAVPALFTTYLEGDVVQDPSTSTLWLSQADLGLPARDYFKDKEVVEIYEEVIRATLKSVYDELDEKTTNIKKLAKETLDFEKKLSNISLDPCVFPPARSHLVAYLRRVTARTLKTLTRLIIDRTRPSLQNCCRSSRFEITLPRSLRALTTRTLSL